jgi:outer membrane receptor for ferrienterochelin and colicin
MRYPQRFQNDVQVSYLINDSISAYAGIQNLFYQTPAIGAAAYPYDPIGRFFYVGFTAQTDFSKLGL